MKRRKRLILEDTAYYHVMSRIIERRFYLGPHEKEMFCDMMKRVAEFSGVNVLTYCVMDNHFHLLIEVPERPVLSLEDVCRRLPCIYRGDELAKLRAEIKQWKTTGNDEMLTKIKQQFERRMYSLPEFMKTLKQRYSIWYNRNHGQRRGTLWEDRFKSVVVEAPKAIHRVGCRAALTVAAYIELNPVRAGIVEDPKDYRWCGYGGAIGGGKSAYAGIKYLVEGMPTTSSDRKKVMQLYRLLLFERNRARAMSGEDVRKIVKERGQLSVLDMIRCRIRYFSDGLVLGGHDFVERVCAQNPDSFNRRRSGKAYQLRGGNWEGLCSARNLRYNVIDDISFT